MGIEYFINLFFSATVIIIILAVKQLRVRVNWWEMLMIILIPFLFSLLFISIVINQKTKTTEYYGSVVTNLYEREPYNEWHHEICHRDVPCGTDKDGNTIYCSEPYDCSHQDDYCADWYLKTNIGENINLNEQDYYYFLNKIGGQRNVIDQIENYAPRDKVKTCWDNKSKFKGKCVGEISNKYESIISITSPLSKQIGVITEHTYENRLKNTDYSVFGYQKVDTADVKYFGLYELPNPENYFYQEIILGENISPKIQEYFNTMNGWIGSKDSCRVFICLFKNKPQSVGLLQESYWVGGNKNEITICIGLDNNDSIQWVYPFSHSFTKSGTLQQDLKDFFYNLPKLTDNVWYIVADNLLIQIHSKFHRIEFTNPSEGFSYLRIDPPQWAVILNIILTLLICLGVTAFSVFNKFDNKLLKNNE
jgi:hypothetical protein